MLILPSLKKPTATSVIVVLTFFATSIFPLRVLGDAGSELKIGSWNIRRLSASSRDNDELKKIAQVIHPMDCVAIMELHDDVVLGKLVVQLETMGGTWRRIQTPAKVGNTSYSAEHYGFVYRSDKLKLRGLPQVLPESTLTIPNDPTPWKFDRQPYTVGFATLDNLLDFRVIVVHVTFHGMPYQRAEVRALKDYFTTVQNSRTTDDDVILCGDFNVNVGDESLNDLLSASGMIDTTSSTPGTKIDTTNTYDHLLFQTNFVKEYTGTHGVEKFDETMFGNNDPAASLACSDHRPIWVILKVPQQDDD